jgi:hypothetical protein
MAERWAIIGNEGYGLYFGMIDASDADIAATKSVRVRQCRHVRYWRGGTGGITSLAAWGPCGPAKNESRIGEPSPESLILNVCAVHVCTPEAVSAFASIEASRG